MALQLRPNCEQCDKDLMPDDPSAMICSFECTFCQSCVDNVLLNVCPNCGGGFVPRPIRPSEDRVNGACLNNHPASEVRVFKPVDKNRHKTFAAGLAEIPPENR